MRIRELIRQPAEAVTKAQLYDHIIESGDPIDARKTIPILVKYSRLMNGLFEDVHKLLPPGGTPRRVFYQAPPGSPSGTLYEAVGEVAVVHNPPIVVEPETSARFGSTGKTSEMIRSSQPRRKNTGSDRSRRGQSPVRRTIDRSRTTDRSRTPVRRWSPEQETTFGKGKSRAHQSSPPECMIMEGAPNTSMAVSTREPELPARSGLPEPPTRSHPVKTLTSKQNPASQGQGGGTPRAEETRDSEDEVVPSPNMRRMLTRLQHVVSPRASSIVGGLDASYKERATPKKPRPSSSAAA